MSKSNLEQGKGAFVYSTCDIPAVKFNPKITQLTKVSRFIANTLKREQDLKIYFQNLFFFAKMTKLTLRERLGIGYFK